MQETQFGSYRDGNQRNLVSPNSHKLQAWAVTVSRCFWDTLGGGGRGLEMTPFGRFDNNLKRTIWTHSDQVDDEVEGEQVLVFRHSDAFRGNLFL